MAFLNLGRGFLLGAVCSALFAACGNNPELVVPPTLDRSEAGAGGDADDDPIALGGAFQGEGGKDGQGMPGTKACGDAVVDSGEQCDDGNREVGDGCSDTCTIEPGFDCVVPGASCEECGNGIKESAEA